MKPSQNTDKEVWRGPDLGPGDYYADSVFITKENGIGINAGGIVIVRSAREWIALAWPQESRLRGIKDDPPKLAEAMLIVMALPKEGKL